MKFETYEGRNRQVVSREILLAKNEKIDQTRPGE
jgi:hypothetical protein